MSLLRRLLKSRPRALAAGLPSLYSGWGEPKPLDQMRLLELAEGDADVRACLDALVDAVITNGWTVNADDKNVGEMVSGWLRAHEDDFWLFLRNLIMTTLIFDEAYIECTSGFPKVIAPWTMHLRRNEYGEVVGYIQQTYKTISFTPDEIVHIILHPLADRAYGSPKIATLARLLMAKREAELFLFQVFMRKGVLSKAIIVKQGDDSTFTRIKNQLENTRPGDNLLLMGEIDIQSLSQPVEDLHIIELLAEFRQRILAVFRVPPIIYGVVEGLNLETSRNQMISFSQSVKSIQRVIASGITKALQRILGLNGFSFRFVEWMNPEQETRLHVLRVGAGLETVNEARAQMGLPPLENPKPRDDVSMELLRESERSTPGR